MTKIGIIEGFFGPTWSMEGRIAFAELMRGFGGDFFIYAPKKDGCLRRLWREPWSNSYLNELKTLTREFHNRQIMIGVGLSPLGIIPNSIEDDLEILKNRFETLTSIGIDLLAIFFDDMPSTPTMLETQSRVIKWAQLHYPKQIIFCPSYYSLDPKLDKVFGRRPTGYVEGLKDHIPQNVSICWTGPQVISDEITVEHLNHMSNILGRKPFLWENFFANDGPRSCKFLKLRYFEGRSPLILKHIEGIGFNLMNQPYLSQLVYLSALFTLKNGTSPEAAFKKSCQTLCTPELAEYISQHRILFLEKGLDLLPDNKINELKVTLNKILLTHTNQKSDYAPIRRITSNKIREEIDQWLNGHYVVGEECLTD